MKNKTITPGFFAELCCYNEGRYQSDKKSARHLSGIVIPQLRINPYAQRRAKWSTTGSNTCSDQLSNCKNNCNTQYPESGDGPNNFNKELREGCLDSCAAGDSLCRNPPQM